MIDASWKFLCKEIIYSYMLARGLVLIMHAFYIFVFV